MAGLVNTVRGEMEAKEILRFDFESGDLQGWQVVEGAFDFLVCDKKTFRNEPTVPYNKQGTFFLTTLERRDGTGSDPMTGVVESPVWVLAGPEMSLLVGGGSHPDTYVALCTLDGQEVLQARGANTEVMQRIQWNVPPLVGQRVFLRVVDGNTGGWGHITLDDFTAQGKIDPEATEWNFARAKFRRAYREWQTVSLPALRAAILDLRQTFPQQYTRGQEFLQRLEGYEKRLADLEAAWARADETALQQAPQLLDEIRSLQREALLANPLVCGQPLLFVVRPQYRPDHHNTETMFQTGEINTGSFQGGGALKVLHVCRQARNAVECRVQTLLEVPEGIIRDPEVHFDGGKIIFSLRRNIEDDYHLYEINADGTGLKQLTFAAGVTDIDPLYLPDDSIAFSSTREPKYCMCNRHIMANLFRMEADGANIHQIGKSTLFEGHAALMPDGRILYDRWEYVDRNFGDAQGLWTCHPDGTNHAVYWGNNTPSPGGVIDARPIPGPPAIADCGLRIADCGSALRPSLSSENSQFAVRNSPFGPQVLCVFGSCHDRPWGALAIIDRCLGMDGRAPVVRTWPAEAIHLVRDPGTANGAWDAFLGVTPKYEDPYPLSDKYFLCSRMTGRGEQMGIYLLDVFGNETLLHVEEPGCFDPMPLGPRPRPPVIPSHRDFDHQEGYFYVHDVYQGTHMQGVQRGTVKFLRVVESPEKRFWTGPAWNGQGQEAPAMNWHDFNNKRILGTVPVEEDGSAYFAVPSDTFVYFQLLDGNGMMVQSMRSGTLVQSGERLGCIGCHEDRRTAPPLWRMADGGWRNQPEVQGPKSEIRNPKSPVLLALRRPPSQLNGWYGPPRLFSYVAEVQPVFDKHCVRCHDYGQEAGQKLNLAGDRNLAFNTSYSELWQKGYIQVVGAGPAEVQPAYSWGSHASRLVEVIRQGHYDVSLDPESFDRLVTWIDINAPYYPTYASAYPDNLYGRSPLDKAQVERLSQLLGVNLGDQGQVTQITFDRPELSPGLAKFTDRNDPNYREALAILRAGRERLARRPRADMPGFQPGAVDQRREEKYVLRQQIERRNREAIRRGEKVYDDRPQ